MEAEFSILLLSSARLVRVTSLECDVCNMADKFQINSQSVQQFAYIHSSGLFACKFLSSLSMTVSFRHCLCAVYVCRQSFQIPFQCLVFPLMLTCLFQVSNTQFSQTFISILVPLFRFNKV